MKRLSKSRYTQFCKCQKNLWLNAYKPEVAVVDASTEARFDWRWDYLGPLWKLPRCKQIGVSILLPWWKRPHRR